MGQSWACFYFSPPHPNPPPSPPKGGIFDKGEGREGVRSIVCSQQSVADTRAEENSCKEAKEFILGPSYK